MPSSALSRAKYAGGVLVCLLFAWIAFVRGARVPLLSLVDLGFHELGHLLTYPFPDVVTALMGSVTQVAVPAGLALYFLLVRRDQLGGGLCLAWAATSARDVSVYVADARAQALPLLGDGIHDWGFVLGRFHALQSAGWIAAAVKALGLVLLLMGFALCAWGLLTVAPRHESGTFDRSTSTVDWTSR
jgi:hypothetical protein